MNCLFLLIKPSCISRCVEYELADLLDIPLIQNLQEKLDAIYSFPSAIIDNKGKILTTVAWQDICIKFHWQHPLCEKDCIKSDLYIFDNFRTAIASITYQYPHGLVDNAIPISIDGKHLGNFFTGPLFHENPNLEFFKKQAKTSSCA